MVFTTLDNTPIAEIHHAFVSAFSDYSVKIDMPLDKFIAFAKGNSVDFSLSAGTLEDSRLCGFILNGIREKDGIWTAYDSGTGVTPQYRKQGLTKRLFAFLLPLLREKGVKRYLLEVIQTNTAAFNIYKGLGFSVTRDLVCFKAPKAKLAAADTDNIRVIPVTDIDIGICEAMNDYSPTWQNSFDAVLAVPEQCAAVIAEQGGEIAGYGIINVKSGSVYQLAVKREMREKGIGAALLCMLSRQTQAKDISFINVDSKCESMLDFLQKLGFEETVRQYEMEFTI